MFMDVDEEHIQGIEPIFDNDDAVVDDELVLDHVSTLSMPHRIVLSYHSTKHNLHWTGIFYLCLPMHSCRFNDKPF